ncbi:alpha/beta hydrolase family protein [Aureibacter tunicatorum]|uniref:Dipeptidyl aminopeptidase/acylaminoacyl peptidase n=1 Tax=Aureibacter tunicatorum TaxID=866807 RepID=A0AAE4BSJ7_9BACT|nr:S9 family peptidase [Aureibacter tunicatorum]MDR6239846.1 dipeptidyl aminopeptidase/acylaminoacyl peptidase [Aureibacter tunicatorum]
MVFAQDIFSEELLWKLGRVNSEQVSPDGKTILYGITTYDIPENKGKNQLYTISINGGDPKKISNEEVSIYNVQWRPDGKKIGFLMQGEIHEMNPDGSQVSQISDTDKKIIAFNYSPNQQKIAIAIPTKTEKTTQDLYPDLDKAEALVIDDLMYRHWDHWSDAYHNHVYVADYSNGSIGKMVDIMENSPYDTPTTPFGGSEDFTFSPDGKKIAYVCKKLTGKEYATSTNSDIYLYDINSGKTTNLSAGMMGYDTHPSFTESGDKIAWLSMKHNGYESDKNEIIVLDLKSNERASLTTDFDETVKTFIWDKTERGVFFMTGIEATQQLFEIKFPKEGFRNVKAKDIRQITSGEHNFTSLQQVGKSLIGLKQSLSAPSEIYKVSIKNGKENQLTFTNQNLLNNVTVGKVEKRWITTTDNKKMLTWVIYPPNFDRNKKYPALLYCQGGPQSTISQYFSYRWNFQLMAAHNYIIVAPNRRGLPSFGTEWNEAISKDWGGQPMKDYMSAIDAVSAEPYVDENNLGAVGASYGGYSVYMLAGIHEGRFKTFISHCGLFDLKSWYGTTEELFFANWDIGGPYWDKSASKSYEKFSPSDYVENWDTPILVIHGGKDFRVPETQGMQAFQAAQLKGIPSKFLYFPNEGHWILSPQNGLIWHKEYFKWLDKWLK